MYFNYKYYWKQPGSGSVEDKVLCKRPLFLKITRMNNMRRWYSIHNGM